MSHEGSMAKRRIQARLHDRGVDSTDFHTMRTCLTRAYCPTKTLIQYLAGILSVHPHVWPQLTAGRSSFQPLQGQDGIRCPILQILTALTALIQASLVEVVLDGFQCEDQCHAGVLSMPRTFVDAVQTSRIDETM